MSEVPDYPKRDLRRMLVVLAAIDTIEEATLVKIARLTGIDKKTVFNLIEKARTQAGVVIEKNDSVYVIESWGPVIKRTGARLALTGGLDALE
jgi:hypothetical protein